MQKACIIIPCYNESRRLPLESFRAFINSNATFNLLFVNDGSTDSTEKMLSDFCAGLPARCAIMSLRMNSGKAEAVRQGMLHAAEKREFDFIGYWDADLSTSLDEAITIISEMEGKDKMIGLASRIKRLGATVERSATRHYLGRVFSTFASMILRLPVYDSQCGAKMFRSELSVLFNKSFISRWLFDVEVLARYRNHYGRENTLEKVIEVPVNSWLEKSGSKLKPSHLLRIPFELLAIHRAYNK